MCRVGSSSSISVVRWRRYFQRCPSNHASSNTTSVFCVPRCPVRACKCFAFSCRVVCACLLGDFCCVVFLVFFVVLLSLFVGWKGINRGPTIRCRCCERALMFVCGSVVFMIDSRFLARCDDAIFSRFFLEWRFSGGVFVVLYMPEYISAAVFTALLRGLSCELVCWHVKVTGTCGLECGKSPCAHARKRRERRGRPTKKYGHSQGLFASATAMV